MSKNKLRIKNKGISLFLLLAEFFCVFTGCTHVSDSPALQDPIEYAAEDTRSAPTKYEGFKEIFMDHDNPIPAEAVEWIDYYNGRFGDGSADRVIMTRDEIDALNREITEKCDAVYDIEYTESTRMGDDVRAMIERYAIPAASTVRRDGSAITSAEREYVFANRNLEKIPDEVAPKGAIITSRCSLRSLPTDIGFYAAGDTYYDKIEETELIAGFPVLVLHESADGAFVFVESYYYRGWVDSRFAAYCSAEKYGLFKGSTNLVTVTAKRTYASGSVLDMGARLPYVSEDRDNFYVSLPSRADDGTLMLATTSLTKSSAVFGSLPFTMKNYFAQAFKYLGTDYGWGGAGGNVDCSGFVCAVMRSFGIYLPRNTGDQSSLSVLLTSVSGTGDTNIKTAIESANSPAAIYRPGHVMLYLGTVDGVIHVIHAPTGGDKVKVAPLTYLTNITGIREFK